MQNRAAIIGGGVSGLTCGVLFGERGWNTTIFADQTGQKTTSAAAAAIWFPYDAEPAEKVVPWALTTFKILNELARNRGTGVSMLAPFDRESFMCWRNAVQITPAAASYE